MIDSNGQKAKLVQKMINKNSRVNAFSYWHIERKNTLVSIEDVRVSYRKYIMHR